ncbi:PfkB family carbohydrate kinase [Lactobacillus sp. ESL0731]|uniref:PfkB family carbohydrate kinase n=1 Tax=unclassified Lactobacillus TaxID=2620435 RepID=UPI0023F844CC|nr:MULTISPECIES: PfkB family carbohydrate kinase [unclassified Lactobacillus]WEV51577.1 PfkB family carbohydrate kinase [Lactobacillus sp. ESL0700]WEV62706.1 PfkB family carbohydrate kinase [Lactobacillus sp. ESL0731]
MKLIAVGDNVTDTYIKQGYYFPGGNCVNVAVDAKKAGAAASAYLGIFGDDDRAEHIKNSLIAENVDLVNCRKGYAPTAQPRVFITDDGNRVFAAGPKNSVQHLFALQLTPDDYKHIKQYDVVHTDIYAAMENNLSQLQEVTKVSFDFSDCRDEDYLKQVLPHVDFAFFSGSDLNDEQVQQMAKSCMTIGPSVVVITRGAKTAFVLDATESYYQEPQKVQIVDTMGAGDSFIAGFLVSYLDKHNLKIAAEDASKSAAITCQLAGGFGHKKSF